MAVMIPPKFGQKIRFNVIGKPGALQDKQSALLKKISKALNSENARLVR
jgi:hypothetical protein